MHDIIKCEMTEHLTKAAVECEFHHSRPFALGKSRTDLS